MDPGNQRPAPPSSKRVVDENTADHLALEQNQPSTGGTASQRTTSQRIANAAVDEILTNNVHITTMSQRQTTGLDDDLDFDLSSSDGLGDQVLDEDRFRIPMAGISGHSLRERGPSREPAPFSPESAPFIFNNLNPLSIPERILNENEINSLLKGNIIFRSGINIPRGIESYEEGGNPGNPKIWVGVVLGKFENNLYTYDVPRLMPSAHTIMVSGGDGTLSDPEGSYYSACTFLVPDNIEEFNPVMSSRTSSNGKRILSISKDSPISLFNITYTTSGDSKKEPEALLKELDMLPQILAIPLMGYKRTRDHVLKMVGFDGLTLSNLFSKVGTGTKGSYSGYITASVISRKIMTTANSSSIPQINDQTLQVLVTNIDMMVESSSNYIEKLVAVLSTHSTGNQFDATGQIRATALFVLIYKLALLKSKPFGEVAHQYLYGSLSGVEYRNLRKASESNALCLYEILKMIKDIQLNGRDPRDLENKKRSKMADAFDFMSGGRSRDPGKRKSAFELAVGAKHVKSESHIFRRSLYFRIDRSGDKPLDVAFFEFFLKTCPPETANKAFKLFSNQKFNREAEIIGLLKNMKIQEMVDSVSSLTISRNVIKTMFAHINDIILNDDDRESVINSLSFRWDRACVNLLLFLINILYEIDMDGESGIAELKNNESLLETVQIKLTIVGRRRENKKSGESVSVSETINRTVEMLFRELGSKESMNLVNYIFNSIYGNNIFNYFTVEIIPKLFEQRYLGKHLIHDLEPSVINAEHSYMQILSRAMSGYLTNPYNDVYEKVDIDEFLPMFSSSDKKKFTNEIAITVFNKYFLPEIMSKAVKQFDLELVDENNTDWTVSHKHISYINYVFNILSTDVIKFIKFSYVARDGLKKDIYDPMSTRLARIISRFLTENISIKGMNFLVSYSKQVTEMANNFQELYIPTINFLKNNVVYLEIYRKRMDLISRFSHIFNSILMLSGSGSNESVGSIIEDVGREEEFKLSDIKVVKYGSLSTYIGQIQRPDLLIYTSELFYREINKQNGDNINDIRTVYHSISEVNAKFASAKESCKQILLKVMDRSLKVGDFLACFVDLGETAYEVYNLIVGGVSVEIEKFNQIYHKEKAITDFLGMHRSMRIMTNGLVSQDVLLSRRQTIDKYSIEVGEFYANMVSYEDYDKLSYLVDVMGNSSYTLQLVLEEMDVDYDVSQFKTQLDMNTLSTVNTDAAVALCEVIEQLRALRPLYKTEHTLEEFWAEFRQWANTQVYPGTGKSSPDFPKTHIVEMLLETVKSGVELFNIHRKLTKDMIELHNEKIKLIAAGHSLYSLYIDGTFSFTVSVNDVDTELLPVDIEELKTVAQISQNTAKTKEEEENATMFLNLLSKIEKLVTVINSLRTLGLPFIKKLQACEGKKQGFCDLSINKIEQHNVMLSQHLREWKTKTKEMYDGFPKLRIIPCFYLFDFLAIIFRLRALYTDNISGAVEQNFVNVRNIFKTYGYDIDDFIRYMKEEANKSHMSVTFEYPISTDEIEKENYDRISEMLTISGFTLSTYTTKIGPIKFHKINQKRTKNAIKPTKELVNFIKETPISVINTMTDSSTRLLYEIMMAEGRCPLSSEVLVATKSISAADISDFLKRAQTLNANKLHEEVQLDGANESLFYIIYPASLNHEAAMRLINFINKEKERRVARLVIIHSSLKQRSYDEFLKCIEEGMIFKYNPAPCPSSSRSKSAPIQFSGWREKAITFVRSDRSGEGKSEFISSFAAKNNLRKLVFNITSSDSVSEVVIRMSSQINALQGDQKTLIHFNLNLYKESIDTYAPILLQIFTMGGCCVNTRYFVVPDFVSSLMIECREGTYNINKYFLLPVTTLAFDINTFSPSEENLVTLNDLIRRYEIYKLRYIKDRFDFSAIDPKYPENKNLLVELLNEFKVEVHSYRQLNDIITVFGRCMKGYKVFEDNARGRTPSKGTVITVLRPSELQQLGFKVFEYVFNTAIDLCRYQFDESLSSETAVSSIEKVQENIWKSISKEDSLNMLFWITDEGYVCNPFYRKNFKIPNDMKIIYESISNGRWGAIESLREKPSEVHFLHEIASFTKRSETYTRELQNYEFAHSAQHVCSTELGRKLMDSYSITPDNALKMLRIFIKTAYRMPVVIIGESGVGKTELLRNLAEITSSKMETLQVHAGTTVSDIESFLAGVEKSTANLNKVWIFFDEANTSTCIQKIEEIVMSRTLNDKPIPDRFTFIIAVNPHRSMSNEEATLYIDYRNPRFKETSLAYTVFPIPASLKNIAFNFGKLSDVEFSQYSRSILSHLSTFAPRGTVAVSDAVRRAQQRSIEAYMDLAHKIVTMSYSTMAAIGILISLRDVVRFKKLVQYFYQNIIYDSGSSSETKAAINEKLVQAILLSTYYVFEMRLPSKEMRNDYEKQVHDVFATIPKFCDVPEWEMAHITNHVEYAFDNECRAFTKNVVVPPSISLNKSLRENLFVISIAIKNKIPIIIMGKPGTSKSLSMQIISLLDKNDTGISSMPKIDVITYQGSRGSTSEGILKAYAQAGRLSRRVDKKTPKSERDKQLKKIALGINGELHPLLKYDHVTVFQFDEIGLAEQTGKRNSLKCLHYILEPRRELVDVNPAFVGISNYSLDLAKVNRCLFLCKLDPDYQELVDTSTDISRAVFKENGLRCPFDGSSLLKKLTRAYIECISQQKAQGIAIYGLRNYYTMVQDIIDQILKDPTPQIDPITKLAISFEKLMEFVQKTFDIFPYDSKFIDPLGIFGNAIAGSGRMDIRIPKPFDLIEYNLSSTNGRHIMIITDRFSTIMDFNAMYNKSGEHSVSIIMDDQEQNFLGRSINVIRVIMDPAFNEANGQQLTVMCECEEIYPSLFSLLNGTYTIRNGVSLCRIAVSGSSNVMSKISPAFRIVVVLFKEQLSNVDSAFINRFEIRHISTEYDLKTSSNPFSEAISDKLESLLDLFENKEDVEGGLVSDFPIFQHLVGKGFSNNKILSKFNPYLNSSISSNTMEQQLSTPTSRSVSGTSTPDEISPVSEGNLIDSIFLRVFSDLIDVYDPIKRLTKNSEIRAVAQRLAPHASRYAMSHFQSSLRTVSLRNGLQKAVSSNYPVTVLILDTHATTDVLNKFISNISSLKFNIYNETMIRDLLSLKEGRDTQRSVCLFNSDKLEKIALYIKYIIPQFIQRYYNPNTRHSSHKLIITACLSAEQHADLHMSVSQYVRFCRVSNGPVNSSITSLIIGRQQSEEISPDGEGITLEIFNETLSDCLIGADFGRSFWNERKKFINRFREIYRTWDVCRMWLDELTGDINKILDSPTFECDILAEIENKSEKIKNLLGDKLKGFLSLVFRERTILPKKETIQLDFLTKNLLDSNKSFLSSPFDISPGSQFHEFPFFFRICALADNALVEPLKPLIGHSSKLSVETLMETIEEVSTAVGKQLDKIHMDTETKRLFLLYYFQSCCDHDLVIPYVSKKHMIPKLEIFKQVIRIAFGIDIDSSFLSLPAYLKVFTRSNSMPIKITKNILASIMSIAFLASDNAILRASEEIKGDVIPILAHRAINTGIQNIQGPEGRRTTRELISLIGICDWGIHNVKAQIAYELNISRELSEGFVHCNSISDIWNFKSRLEHSILSDVRKAQERSAVGKDSDTRATIKMNKERLKVYRILVAHISNEISKLRFVKATEGDKLVINGRTIAVPEDCKILFEDKDNILGSYSLIVREVLELADSIFKNEKGNTKNRLAATTMIHVLIKALLNKHYIYATIFNFDPKLIGGITKEEFFNSFIRCTIFSNGVPLDPDDDLIDVLTDTLLTISFNNNLFDKLAIDSAASLEKIINIGFGERVEIVLTRHGACATYIFNICACIDAIKRSTYFDAATDKKAKLFMSFIAKCIKNETIDGGNMLLNTRMAVKSRTPQTIQNLYYPSYGFLACLIRVGLGSPIIKNSRYDLQMIFDDQEGPLNAVKISNISSGVFKRFNCIPLKPIAQGVDNMLSLSDDYEFKLLSSSNEELSTHIMVLANTFLVSHFVEPSSKLRTRFMRKITNFKKVSGMTAKSKTISKLSPYVSTVLDDISNKVVISDPIETSLAIITGAACAEATKQFKASTFLNLLYFPNNATESAVQMATVFFPCMPVCDEIVAFNYYEGRICGIIQCTKCFRILQYVDNGCGRPNPEDQKMHELVCQCGAKGQYGREKVEGELRNLSSFTYDELQEELKRYRSRFSDEPGYKGIPGGDEAKRTSTVYRNMSANGMYLVLTVMLALMSTNQRNRDICAGKEADPIYGKYNYSALKTQLTDSFKTLCFANKTKPETMCLFVLSSVKALINCFASAPITTRFSIRDKMEEEILKSKEINFGDPIGAANSFIDNANKGIDPKTEKIINIANYKADVDFYQIHARNFQAITKDNETEILTDLYRHINKKIGIEQERTEHIAEQQRQQQGEWQPRRAEDNSEGSEEERNTDNRNTNAGEEQMDEGNEKEKTENKNNNEEEMAPQNEQAEGQSNQPETQAQAQPQPQPPQQANNNNEEMETPDADKMASNKEVQEQYISSKYAFLALALHYSVDCPALRHFQHFMIGISLVSNIIDIGIHGPNGVVPLDGIASMPVLKLGRLVASSNDIILSEYGTTLVSIFPDIVAFYRGLPETINMPQAGNECGAELDRPSFQNPEVDLSCAFLMPTKSLVVNGAAGTKDIPKPGEVCLAACNTMCRLTQEIRNLHAKICSSRSDVPNQVVVSVNNYSNYRVDNITRNNNPAIISINTVPHAASNSEVVNHITLSPLGNCSIDYSHLYSLFVDSFVSHKVSLVMNTDDRSVTEVFDSPVAAEATPEQFCDRFVNDLYQNYADEYLDTTQIEAIASKSSTKKLVLTGGLWLLRRVLTDIVEIPIITGARANRALKAFPEINKFISERAKEVTKIVNIPMTNLEPVIAVISACPISQCCSFYEALEGAAMAEFIETQTPQLFKEELPKDVSIKKIIERRQTAEERCNIVEFVKKLHELIGRLLVRIFIPSYFCGSRRLEFHSNLVNNMYSYSADSIAKCKLIIYLNGTESVDYIWNEYWTESGTTGDVLTRLIESNNVSIYNAYALWRETGE